MSKSNLTTNLVPANDNTVVLAKPTSLRAQYRAAKDAITGLNSVVNNLLDGQGGIGRRAALAAYTFTAACIDNPVEAAKLPGWEDAAVSPGTNPYGQPLKLLADDVNNVVQSRISIWAKVFREAHQAGITPEKFLEHLKRNHGMRRWYDAIVRQENPANNNGKKGGSGKSSGTGGKATPTAKPKPAAPVPVDITQRVKDTKRITFAIIDMESLLCDGDAKADLESNPVVLGIVQVANDDCCAFLNDNDPRFVAKGAA